MKKFIKILKSPWFLALLPAVVTVLLIPDFSSRYILSTEKSPRTEAQIVYEDLNGDGESEYVSTESHDNIYYGRVNIADHQGSFHDQWNIKDSIDLRISGLFFGDHDGDKLKEIYLFSRKDDSLFLNVNEFFDPTGLHISRQFISMYGIKGTKDISTHLFGMFDRNGDGKAELFFSITSGFGLWPRLVYSFDLESRALKTSPYTTININNPEMKDVDGDGRPEIFSETSASGNHHFPTPYSDYTAWLVVYGDDLQFKFPPIGFEGFANNLITNGITNPDFKGYVTMLGANPATSKEKSRLMVLSVAGKIIKERTFDELRIKDNPRMEMLPYKGQERIFVFSNPIIILDENLMVVSTLDLPKTEQTPAMSFPFIVDINRDGKRDLIVRLSDEKTYAVYNHDLKFMGTFNLPVNNGEQRVSVYQTTTDYKLLFKTMTQGYFVKLNENPYYFLSYFIYTAVYFAFVLFILIVQKITTAQVVKQEQQKRRIQELQLRSIKGQLDPHFTFNALNAIGSMLQLEDRNVAYDYLSKFTRLLRQLIGDSDRIYRSLEEELEFVTAYLQLEKIRFEEKFDFTIHVDEAITKKEMIPIMCIQIFAENAIRHGIMPLEQGGLVSIAVRKEKDYVVITIQDNGIGRKKADEDNPHNGRGLKMTREFYDILNQTNARPISYVIKDLYDGEKAVGTKAEVRVPVAPLGAD